eukprot:TRINITY_DN19901_c0_g1_i1.p1 TRINITY_DN19901_c0_g1~~TRINITY_DN19901_c0_g1_i1.p1  ORF type:complete len:167 (-),score=34.25 TRINITY_DN19901_c0_g1_i1:28-462(-)
MEDLRTDSKKRSDDTKIKNSRHVQKSLHKNTRSKTYKGTLEGLRQEETGKTNGQTVKCHKDKVRPHSCDSIQSEGLKENRDRVVAPLNSKQSDVDKKTHPQSKYVDEQELLPTLDLSVPPLVPFGPLSQALKVQLVEHQPFSWK